MYIYVCVYVCSRIYADEKSSTYILAYFNNLLYHYYKT